jgi:hypothetical protein
VTLCRQLQTLRRNVLPPSSRLKRFWFRACKVAAGFIRYVATSNETRERLSAYIATGQRNCSPINCVRTYLINAIILLTNRGITTLFAAKGPMKAVKSIFKGAPATREFITAVTLLTRGPRIVGLSTSRLYVLQTVTIVWMSIQYNLLTYLLT